MSAEPVTTAEWLAAVRGAGSEGDLLAVMQRYVASLSADELARVPARCRPARPETREEIQESAVVLAREELMVATGAAGGEVLRQMAAVFAEASTRLTRMVDRSLPPGPKG